MNKEAVSLRKEYSTISWRSSVPYVMISLLVNVFYIYFWVSVGHYKTLRYKNIDVKTKKLSESEL